MKSGSCLTTFSRAPNVYRRIDREAYPRMSTESAKRQRIAVVGGGVAGIVSAYLLARRHDVVLFEAANYVGGHTNTVTIPSGLDAGVAVDTGFIVLNDQTYPQFHRFLAALGVNWRWADMSFSFWCKRSNLQYCSRTLNTLFAQRRNLLRPSFLAMLLEVTRLWRVGRNELESPAFEHETLGEWLARHHFRGAVVEDYLTPISAAIWSSPPRDLLNFPVSTFLSFYKNHGLLQILGQPRWQTVVGGSHSYVKAFLKSFKGTVRLNAAVRSIARTPESIRLSVAEEDSEEFDQVVVATHADQALRILADATDDERAVLGPWRYQKNVTVLHTDTSFLPSNPRAQGSWNYVREAGENGENPVSVTYDMTRLQGLTASKRYCVTLNPRRPITEGCIVKELQYEHPLFTAAAIESRKKLDRINGMRRTWFCGSYFGWGFHEDAVRGALAVTKRFGEGFSEEG